MSASTSKPTGEGTVRQTFALTGRGLVLVIEEGFSGAILRDGIVQSHLGSASYGGVETVDGRDGSGARKAWCALVVDPAVEPFFPPGASVRFYRGA